MHRPPITFFTLAIVLVAARRSSSSTGEDRAKHYSQYHSSKQGFHRNFDIKEKILKA